MEQVTCGIFLVDPNKNLLIVHATNARWNTWGIPKGMPDDENESYKEVAIRELFEETSLNINHLVESKTRLKYLGSSKYAKQKKTLEAFYLLLDKPIVLEDLKCLSMVEKSGKDPFPEIDKYKTVSLEEAKKWLHQTQIDLLPILKTKIDHETLDGEKEKGKDEKPQKKKKIIVKVKSSGDLN